MLRRNGLTYLANQKLKKLKKGWHLFISPALNDGFITADMVALGEIASELELKKAVKLFF